MWRSRGIWAPSTAAASNICVEASSNSYDYLFDSVQCYIKSAEQTDRVMEMSAGDPITVRGKITAVGEVLGYSLDIDSID